MNNNNGKKPSPLGGIIIYFLVFALVIGMVSLFRGGLNSSMNANIKTLEFSEFVAQLEADNVKEITATDSRRYYGYLKDGTYFESFAPTAYDMAIISEEYLVPMASEGLTVHSVRPNSWGAFLNWLPTLLMIALMIFFWVSFSRSQGGGKGVMSFGKSRAQMVKDGKNKVTFQDVAGLQEEKNELQEIVDFLKNPKKYTELGARIPKGVLLVGPPGTGKTFISKAVAGEADVPFFSISGSDFVEMFVGVGASRVRDLFADAKKNAPCIVFIDEIDAVGRRRGAGIGGGNDEREQTLNQLLVELDGFGVNEGIIVIAATNRPDVLDPAILRPGRFDRQVVIGIPDVKGREEVFKIYAKNKPIDENVDLKTLAKRTPGFTPADIENMMNEAALLTARRNGSIIHMDDLEEAITRVIAGPEKKSRVMSEKEKKLTAFHEAGHAVVARCLPGYDPVHQVTIMPRGMAGGFTMTLPPEDRYYSTKNEMKDDIVDLLGGRVAEALVLGDISTGASNDLERATKTAHDMVAKYGMSEKIGPVNYSSNDEVFLGYDFTSKQNYSEDLAAKIDAEVKSIIEEAYARTEQILTEHRTELDRIANALMEMETIDGDEFEALFTNEKTVEELKAANASEKAARQEFERKEAEEAEKRRAAEAAQTDDLIRTQIQKGKRVAVMDKYGKLHIVDAPKDLQAQNKENAPMQEDSAEASGFIPQQVELRKEAEAPAEQPQVSEIQPEVPAEPAAETSPENADEALEKQE